MRLIMRSSFVSCVPLCALVTACTVADRTPVPPSSVQQLELTAGAPLALTLRATGTGQEGVAGDDNEVRLRTALRTDSDAEARLCGVIVARSRSLEQLPFAWPVDSTMPQLVPQLVNGRDVQGFRVLVPGANAEYRFEGFTTDGSTRVSLRWPVRSDRAVPGDAADSEIEAALTPSPRTLDSLVMQLRRRTPAPDGTWRGRVPAAGTVDSSGAVRLVRLIPLFPVGFTPPCGDATFSISLPQGVDQVVRVLAASGETVSAQLQATVGSVSMRFDEEGAGSTTTGRAPAATVVAKGDGHVTLRLRYLASPTEPARQTALLRLSSTRSP